MRELSLHILDVLENSLEAGATCVELTIEEDVALDRLTITRVNGQEFEFHTADMRTELGEIPLTHPAARNWLQKFIAEGETELGRRPQ